MTSINNQDILFDDFSILIKLIGKNELNRPSTNNDCDCAGYSSTSSDEDFDTHQIPQSFGKTN